MILAGHHQGFTVPGADDDGGAGAGCTEIGGVDCFPASWAVKLCVCENRYGWLVASGLHECMLVCFSAVRILPFTLL